MLLLLVKPGHFSRHNDKAVAARRRLFHPIKYFIIKPENALKMNAL